MNPTNYQTRPGFRAMLWYWAAISDGATVAQILDLDDCPEERDELEPYARRIVALYHASRASLLEPATLAAFERVLADMEPIRDRHATAWLARHYSYAQP